MKWFSLPRRAASISKDGAIQKALDGTAALWKLQAKRVLASL
jgi:hypothetical protein